MADHPNKQSDKSVQEILMEGVKYENFNFDVYKDFRGRMEAFRRNVNREHI